jgi:hypothetical protein
MAEDEGEGRDVAGQISKCNTWFWSAFFPFFFFGSTGITGV